VSPNSGSQGQTGLQLVITGANTHFDNTSVVTFCSGITVSTTAATNSTSITVNVNIATNAALGPCSVTVTTAGEIVTDSGLFNITTPAGPVSITISTSVGVPGLTTLVVPITGQSTHFVNGTTQVNFG